MSTLSGPATFYGQQNRKAKDAQKTREPRTDKRAKQERKGKAGQEEDRPRS